MKEFKPKKKFIKKIKNFMSTTDITQVSCTYANYIKKKPLPKKVKVILGGVSDKNGYILDTHLRTVLESTLTNINSEYILNNMNIFYKGDKKLKSSDTFCTQKGFIFDTISQNKKSKFLIIELQECNTNYFCMFIIMSKKKILQVAFFPYIHKGGGRELNFSMLEQGEISMLEARRKK
jgi:hypothetical protein